MNTLAYIAACEIVSPNSPEFESVHNYQRDKRMAAMCRKLRGALSDALDEGAIDDEQFCELFDAIKTCDTAA